MDDLAVAALTLVPMAPSASRISTSPVHRQMAGDRETDDPAPTTAQSISERSMAAHGSIGVRPAARPTRSRRGSRR